MTYPTDKMPAIHPGEFLKDEIEAISWSATRFAKHLGVPTNAITTIINGDRSITAQMAIRLAGAFGTTPQYWLNLQTIYDLKLADAELHMKGIETHRVLEMA